MLNQHQRGFTLLELLVVITLMGLVATAGLAMVNSLSERERTDIPHDLTKSKLAQIRYAMIGDSSLSLNNSPMLSGYVADMGRLPANINELIELGIQPAWAPIALSAVTTGATGEVWGGWRGPYLTSMPEDAIRTFRDGWGNKNVLASINPTATGAEIEAEDNRNFGWVVGLSPVTVPVCTTVPDCTEITVQSLGADGLVGGNAFDADYPATGLNLVRANEWQQTSTITFDISFNKKPTCTPLPCTITDLELRIYNFEDDVIVDGTGTPANAPKDSVVIRSSNPHSVDPNYPALDPAYPIITFSLDDTTISPVPVTITETFPMGRYAAVVWCTAGNKVYNGDCTGSTPKQPYYFTMLNSTSKITIPWNIPQEHPLNAFK